MNYGKFLSSEVQKKLIERNLHYAERLLEMQKLSTDNLIDTTKYYLSQMSEPRHWNPDDPVYDAIFYYIIIPEILRRLKSQ